MKGYLSELNVANNFKHTLFTIFFESLVWKYQDHTKMMNGSAALLCNSRTPLLILTGHRYTTLTALTLPPEIVLFEPIIIFERHV